MEFKPNNSNDVVSNNNTVSGVAIAHHSNLNPPPPDISALTRLSDNLEFIVDSIDFDFFFDAKIVVYSGREVPVQRCILSARSSFFKNLFSTKDEGLKARFELQELAKDYDVSLDSLLAVLGYLYSGKLISLPKGICFCVDDACPHVVCKPVVDFMVEVLYAAATFQIFDLVPLYQIKRTAL